MREALSRELNCVGTYWRALGIAGYCEFHSTAREERRHVRYIADRDFVAKSQALLAEGRKLVARHPEYKSVFDIMSASSDPR